MLKLRSEARAKAKEKALEKGLMVIKTLGNLENMTVKEVGEVVRRTSNVKDFNNLEEFENVRRGGKRGRRPKKERRYDVDDEILAFTTETGMATGRVGRPQDDDGSPTSIYQRQFGGRSIGGASTGAKSRSPSPTIQTLKLLELTEEELGGVNRDSDRRDQDSMDMLLSSSAADGLMKKSGVLNAQYATKDVGRTVDDWSAFNKIHIPPTINRGHSGGLKAAKAAYLREMKSMKHSGSMGKLRVGDPANMPYEFSLKGRIKSLQNSGMEAVSPKHAIGQGEWRRGSEGRPISPSDFFKK